MDAPTIMTPTLPPSQSCENSSTETSSHPETLTIGPSRTCSPATSPDTPNAISLQGAASGQSQLDLLDGLTTGRSGPAPVRASRSARPAKGSEQMIQGICGRTFIASSVPAGPLSSWESRLRKRLAMVGSTESALIWREKATPAGASISRLAPSMRHTNETGCIESLWTTPLASDVRKQSENPETTVRRHGKNQMIGLNAHMALIAYSASKGGPNMSFGAGGTPLPAQMCSYNPTPTVADVQGGRKARSGARSKEPLLNGLCFAMDRGGQTPNGSSARSTAKRGAPNPAFPFWLMGFPDEWTSGALAAMQLFRSSRQKSLRRSSTPKQSEI